MKHSSPRNTAQIILSVAAAILLAGGGFIACRRPRLPGLRVTDAVHIVGGQVAKVDATKNTFGPGLDCTLLDGQPAPGQQLRWTVQAPEGDYYIGQLILVDRFFDASEFRTQQFNVYVNDTRLALDLAHHARPAGERRRAEPLPGRAPAWTSPCISSPATSCGWCR